MPIGVDIVIELARLLWRALSRAETLLAGAVLDTRESRRRGHTLAGWLDHCVRAINYSRLSIH